MIIQIQDQQHVGTKFLIKSKLRKNKILYKDNLSIAYGLKNG